MVKIKLWVIALALLAGYAFAGDFDEALTAFQRRDFVTAQKLLQPMADQGQPKAQAAMAFVLFFRNDLPKDYASAVSWAKKAADQGESMGLALLGMSMLNGQGGQQDNAHAILLIKQAADRNNPLGQYELGKLMLVGRATARDLIEGEAQLKRAAASSPFLKDDIDLLLSKTNELDQWRSGLARLSCDSFMCAGSMGFNRKQMKDDHDKMMWVELAARALNVGFRNDLGYFYLGRASEGLGDFSAAITYYRFALSPIYRGLACAGWINTCDGFEFPKDVANRLDAVRDVQRNAERLEAERLALAKRAREEAEEAAVIQLAQERDVLTFQKAVASFIDANQKAQLGSIEAQYHLAEMYFTGTGTSIDEKAGLFWLSKAALQGHSDAQYDLGERYRKGLSVAQDNLKAEMWFQKAIQQGHADTDGGLAALLADKQERAKAAADAAKKRAAAAAAIEKKQDEERAELARKTKLENAAKLKSL